MRTLFLFILVLIFSCGQKKTVEQKEDPKKAGTVSPIILTPKQVRERYIQTYNTPIEFTSLDEGKPGEEIRVWGRYYCLFDNGVKIPSKFVEEDDGDSFVTHNFAADIAIVSNNDTIIRKTITRKDFAGKLPPDIADYGIISAPTFYGYNSDEDAFSFYFNISIPVTNTAASRILHIKRNGQLSITSR